MATTINQYLERIQAKYGEEVAKIYSDFLFHLYKTNVDAFVEQSVKHNFMITMEWVQKCGRNMI